MNVASQVFRLWLDNPALRDAVVEAGVRMAQAGALLPSSFGTRSRAIASFHHDYKMHEWILWTRFYSIPLLNEIGFPQDLLAHWAHFAAMLNLILDKSPMDEVRRLKINTHAIEFNVGFERLYVQGDPTKLGRFTPSIHRLLHWSDSVFYQGNPVHTSQFPLERHIGRLKSAIHSPSEPYINLCKYILIRAEMELLRIKYPNAWYKDSTEPRQAYSLLGCTPTKASLRAHMARIGDQRFPQALQAFLSRKGCSPGVVAVEEYISTAMSVLPCMALPHGVKLASELDELGPDGTQMDGCRSKRHAIVYDRDERLQLAVPIFFLMLPAYMISATESSGTVSALTVAFAWLYHSHEPMLGVARAASERELAVIPGKAFVEVVAVMPSKSDLGAFYYCTDGHPYARLQDVDT